MQVMLFENRNCLHQPNIRFLLYSLLAGHESLWRRLLVCWCAKSEMWARFKLTKGQIWPVGVDPDT